ncbi:superoxide dismutase family protein [Actinokineospora auranticolor]|uniref:Cu-Zn family superoxide dismutase n=1 Tax=Actinokineospora auranticolor TaxID=155976 RepID=A0A2S6GD15_9PSEU|nr:superoxide dismutase family protein [Actinokineospora auranticolor]PPK63109.1 Cu-Zn family superoxide dismutase [Actinokineospora auranticolor]
MRTLLSVAAALLMTAAAVTPASAGGGHGVFEPYRPGAKAVTYDPAKVPVGSRASVMTIPSGRKTTVVLWVYGLLPYRHYGAHVHVKPCGPSPADAGPHFQDQADPVQPSVDPNYANPRNEIWLDFATDEKGEAFAVSNVLWRFGDRPANAVIIHDSHTHTGPGEAGTAGARLACFNSKFSSGKS